ncbi:MAG: hypothetical protein C0616_10730 [Desulfuromonas sp.]|nr:MAG: hypothetical protein C0616_10730 [Desulfuromonas sp.]
MSLKITMPKLSDTMEEGIVLSWRIKVGDSVKRGDLIAEVETDKAAMEMEAYEDGVVAEICVDEGETVAVGTLLAVLETEDDQGESDSESTDESAAKVLDSESDVDREETEKPEEKKEEHPPHEQSPPSALTRASGDRPIASPAARRLARDCDIDLKKVQGSGPGGRIVLADVESFSAENGIAEKEQELAPIPRGGREEEKSVKIRRIMARKMAESWTTIPHFYVTFSVDMTDVIKFKKDLGVTINDFVIAAAAHAIGEHPWVNSWWVDGEAVEQAQINIAMAVATDRGLYNPVIKDCGSLSLNRISQAANELAKKAQSGRLAPGDFEDGTFTISNMGMLGVESFRAIITPPQAAVLAIGTVRGEVVVDEKGEPAVAPIMRMTLAADHRILDGADAAEFMATLKSYLEAPVTLVS